MSKKIKIILLIIVIAIISASGLIGYKIYNDRLEEKEVVLEKEHYKKMTDKMYAYYKIMYKNMKVSEDKKDKKIKIFLGTLEREGFPMDEFVNYKTKEKCDTALSYAERTIENNKYAITIYYKCGNVTNYKLAENK